MSETFPKWATTTITLLSLEKKSLSFIRSQNQRTKKDYDHFKKVLVGSCGWVEELLL